MAELFTHGNTSTFSSARHCRIHSWRVSTVEGTWQVSRTERRPRGRRRGFKQCAIARPMTMNPSLKNWLFWFSRSRTTPELSSALYARTLSVLLYGCWRESAFLIVSVQFRVFRSFPVLGVHGYKSVKRRIITGCRWCAFTKRFHISGSCSSAISSACCVKRLIVLGRVTM